MCHICALSVEAGRGTRYPGTGVTEVCECHIGVLGFNLRSSRRTSSALDHGATFLAPLTRFLTGALPVNEPAVAYLYLHL